MVQEGIIRSSTSSWYAPTVCLGEIRNCVNYVHLNGITKKDLYPIPCAKGPRQKLVGKRLFSKLDLHDAYWQFTMVPACIEKTVFCPELGYGLWEFTRMPYALTGASHACLRGLDCSVRIAEILTQL